MLVDKLVMGGQYLRNNSKKGDHGPWGAWNQMLNLNTHACSAQKPYTYSTCPKRKTQLIVEELVPSLLEFLRSLSKALTTSRSVICQDSDKPRGHGPFFQVSMKALQQHLILALAHSILNPTHQLSLLSSFIITCQAYNSGGSQFIYTFIYSIVYWDSISLDYILYNFLISFKIHHIIKQ